VATVERWQVVRHISIGRGRFASIFSLTAAIFARPLSSAGSSVAMGDAVAVGAAAGALVVVDRALER
jgi:hypothetical protein